MKICAVDTETTDVDMSKAKIVELSILPLNMNYTVDTDMKPFSVLVNPGPEALDRGSEALAFNKIGRDTIEKDGVPSEALLPMVRGWMMANGFDTIQPLGHNWGYDRAVLINNFGAKEVERIFFRRSKDSHTAALFVNDIFSSLGRGDFFRSTRLSDLAKHFRFDASGAHRALFDCEMSAKVYKKLIEIIKEHIQGGFNCL